MKQLKLLIFWVARSSGLFALSRHLTRAQPRILCYHGGCIGDESRFNPKLFMSTERFSARMQWLRAHGFAVTGLDEIGAAIQGNGALAPRSVALTFDDGWHSTASELLPVLARMQMPSTLYLCTSHYQEQWPVMAVVLRYLLWKSPSRLVRIEGFAPEVDGTHDLDCRHQRERLADAARSAILADARNESAVNAQLERLADCLGVATEELNLAQRRFAYLSPLELTDAVAMGCRIELHGHQHFYPIGDPARFKADLIKCGQIIADAGLPRARHFCYPSGTHDAAASSVLGGLGIVTATTCVTGLVGAGQFTDLHYLPRFVDGDDVHTLEFEAEMSGFTELLRRVRKRSAHV